MGLPLAAIPGLWQRGLAQAVVSAMSGALAALLMASVARAWGWGRARYLLVAAFVLHPVTIFLSATGLSEMVFFAAVLAQLRCLVGWWSAAGQGDRRAALGWLVGLGVAAAAGGLTRYEGWVLAGLWALVVTLRLWPRGLAPDYWQASLVVYGTIPLYAALLWVFSNWLIMGDPWYFARGAYAAAAEAAVAAGAVTGWWSVAAVAAAGWQLWPPFWAALMATVVAGIAGRNGRLIAFSACWGVLIGFYALALGVGQVAFLQYRYLGFVVPAGLTLVAAALGDGRARPAIQTLVGLGLVVVGPVVGLRGMLTDPAPLGNSMRPVAETVLGRPAELWAAERAMADYLRTTRGPVLADGYGGVELVMFWSGDPGRFIVPSDRDFATVLEAPWNGAAYILVPYPEGVNRLNRVNRVYPSLYEAGAEWAVLDYEIGRYRLYRVLPPVGAAAAPGPRDTPPAPDGLRWLGVGLGGACAGAVGVALLRRVSRTFATGRGGSTAPR